MSEREPRSVVGAEAERVRRLFPSYRDFVDDCLFHPVWGYYSTGSVRFGEGGHYDTFPIALSPFFGVMVARYAHRRWKELGSPSRFEIAEIGAGNGQLALDTLLALERPRRQTPSWRRFAEVVVYRVIERSLALTERQRAHLGPLARKVRWLRADLSRGDGLPRPLASHGLLIANEVLDCLAHHKIVPHRETGAGVVHVVPRLGRGGAPVPHTQLTDALARPSTRRRLHFEEVVVPIDTRPELRSFLDRYYPELLRRKSFPPYFACPETETLIRNTGSLYSHADAIWIDYGDDRSFHLRSREARKVFAGPPRSGASIFDNPGRDDVTFMVDFSVVGEAAELSDWKILAYAGQRELARRSGVRLGVREQAQMLEQRTLQWMLALLGVGPEKEWRRRALTWSKGRGARLNLKREVERAVQEFLGLCPSYFKLMLLRR